MSLFIEHIHSPWTVQGKQKQMWMAQGEKGDRCIKRRLGDMHSKEVLHGSNFQHHPMGGSHRSPCREAFNDQLVWIGHETNERHDTV